MTVEQTEYIHAWLDDYEAAQREASEQLNKGH